MNANVLVYSWHCGNGKECRSFSFCRAPLPVLLLLQISCLDHLNPISKRRSMYRQNYQRFPRERVFASWRIPAWSRYPGIRWHGKRGFLKHETAQNGIEPSREERKKMDGVKASRDRTRRDWDITSFYGTKKHGTPLDGMWNGYLTAFFLCGTQQGKLFAWKLQDCNFSTEHTRSYTNIFEL